MNIALLKKIKKKYNCGAQMIYGPDPSIRGNPKAQAEEGWGPDSIGWPLDAAEGSSVLGRPKVPLQKEG